MDTDRFAEHLGTIAMAYASSDSTDGDIERRLARYLSDFPDVDATVVARSVEAVRDLHDPIRHERPSLLTRLQQRRQREPVLAEQLVAEARAIAILERLARHLERTG